jgi:hypothetical protein
MILNHQLKNRIDPIVYLENVAVLVVVVEGKKSGSVVRRYSSIVTYLNYSYGRCGPHTTYCSYDKQKSNT